MTDLTYDLKNDVEHVEEGVDKPHGTIIPYPRTLRDMPDPPSPAALALGFELQKQDMSHGFFKAMGLGWRMLLMSLPYMISSLGGGYDSGSSGMIQSMPSFLLMFGGFDAVSETLALPSNWVALWQALACLSTAIGALSCTTLLEKLGPRRTNFTASIVVLPGIALCACATSRVILLFGKTFIGLSLGIFVASSSNFVAESAVGPVRAFCSVSIGMFFLVGVMLGLATGFGLIDVIDSGWGSWRLVYLISFIMPALSLVGLLFVPTSPIYLVKRNQPHEALKSLTKLHGSKTSADCLRARLAVIQHTVALEAEQKKHKGSPSFRDLWSNPIDRRRTITNAGIWLAYQASGAVFLANGLYFLLVFGVDVVTGGQIIIAMFTLPILLNLILPYVLDRLGRRTLFVWGNLIQRVHAMGLEEVSTALMLTLGCLGFAKSHGAKLAVAVLMQLGNGTIQLSTGAPVYALNAEISSMRLRALSQSFGLSMGYLAQFALTMAVPYIYQAPGWLLAKTALIFAGTSAMAVVWGYFYVGETAGRTVEEVDALYEYRIPARHWRKTDVASLNAVSQ